MSPRLPAQAGCGRAGPESTCLLQAGRNDNEELDAARQSYGLYWPGKGKEEGAPARGRQGA